MSDDSKPAESPGDALLGLTSLDFGPAWARGETDKKERGGAEGKGKRRREDRDRDGGGERRRGDRREGRGRDERRDHRDRGRREGHRDRQEGDRDRRGGGRRFDNKGRRGQGRRDDDRGRPPREETPPPEGIKASVMPVEDGLDGLAKEILAGGRTYSVFDLAKLVLGARERFNVNFQSEGERPMYRCKLDGSLWLNKEEAVRQFWRSEWRKDYYEEVVSEAKPPAGNFQAVARCGISGELLGPPNYHGYQPAVVQLHRERFGNMPLDLYKKKIRMERGEEAVAAWLEKMSKRVAYRPTGGVKPEGAGEAPAEKETATAESAEAEATATADPEDAAAETEVVAESAGESAEAESDAAATGVEEAGESAGEADPESEAGAEDAPAPAGEPTAEASGEPLLEELRDVERHFLEHHFEDAFLATNRAWVSGNIPGNHLSPGLLTLLRQTVAEERRYPGKLTPMLCRQLSGRHVAVFKWRRKLKAGPSRPHPVPADIVIADRPKALLNWISENSGKKLQALWKRLLPEQVRDEEKLGWYHDLHWLLNQGYVLLMADNTVHLAKGPSGEEGAAQRRTAKKKGREGKGKSASGKQTDRAAAASAVAVPVAADAPPSARPSGLYAISGRTLNGTPKSPEYLSGRGLWPQPHRFESGEEEDQDGEEGDS